MKRIPIVVLLMAGAIRPASAQSPGAVYGGGDTLRFSQVTTIKAVTEGLPMGPRETNTEIRSRIAVVAGMGDTLRVFYEASTTTARTPAGETTTSSNELLGKPYVVTVSPRGVMTAIAEPPMPGRPAGLGLSNPNWGFGFVMPQTSLVVGASWSDTLVQRLPPPIDMTSRRVTRYVVKGDTVLHGDRAWVIEATMTAKMDGGTPHLDEDVEIAGVGTDGRETLWFDPRRRIVVQRDGSTTARTSVRAAAMTVNSTQTIATTFSLIRP